MSQTPFSDMEHDSEAGTENFSVPASSPADASTSAVDLAKPDATALINENDAPVGKALASPCTGADLVTPTVSARTDADIPERRRRSWWRFLGKFVLVLFVIIVAACGYLAWDGWHFLQTPPSSPGKDVIVDIEPGSTLAQAAAQLEARGAIADSLRFQILARVKKQENKIQAGRFLVNTGWLPDKVLEQLATGKAMLYRVTIPEGLTWWEVGRILEREGMCAAADFENVTHDPEFLGHWGIPFTSAEGFLYPDTYFMPKPREWNEQAARSAANRLVDMFWRKTAALWPDGRPTPDVLRRAVTLAAIVEKETAVPAERPRVAGVYANRLAKNMLLQADPTIIYGLGPDFSGPLLRRQLDDGNNPYNTYQRPGLPPGPICSPGEAALRAAVFPETHNYLYFVAKGDDGSHVFSETLNDHNNAVRAYRRTLRRQSN